MTAPLVQEAQNQVAEQAVTLGVLQQQAQGAAEAYLLQAGKDSDIFYNRAATTRMSLALARMIDSYAVTAARVTDRFTAELVHLANPKDIGEGLFGVRKIFKPVGVRATTGISGENGVREAISTPGVFGRVADTYRYQQSLLDKQFIEDVKAGAISPTELASPLDAAVDRARRAAQMNVALAVRNQARATMTEAAKDGLVIGYRRVVHAELSTEGSCGLCIAASTRIYRIDHLMPMHPGCHCIPMPVSKSHDPGAAVNDHDLGRFYTDAGGTSTEDLRNTRYKVDEHGEIGPVLRPFGKPIRKEGEARADTRHRRVKDEEARIRTLTNKRDRLQAAYDRATGEDESWRERLASVSDRIAALNRDIAAAGGH